MPSENDARDLRATTTITAEDTVAMATDASSIRMTPGPAAIASENPYFSWPACILGIVSHTEREHTFRLTFAGDVRPGQFFEVSIPRYGEAPISVGGIDPHVSVDLTIRNMGRVTGERRVQAVTAPPTERWLS